MGLHEYNEEYSLGKPTQHVFFCVCQDRNVEKSNTNHFLVQIQNELKKKPNSKKTFVFNNKNSVVVKDFDETHLEHIYYMDQYYSKYDVNFSNIWFMTLAILEDKLKNNPTEEYVLYIILERSPNRHEFGKIVSAKRNFQVDGVTIKIISRRDVIGRNPAFFKHVQDRYKGQIEFVEGSESI